MYLLVGVGTSNTGCPVGFSYSSASAIDSTLLTGSTENDGACTACAMGKSKNTNNFDPCATCAPGRLTIKIGSSVCISCPAGKLINVSTTTSEVVGCSDCAAGTFGSQKESYECSHCPRGYSQPLDGQTYCLPCIPGTAWTNKTSQSVDNCQQCPANTYSPTTRSVGCVNCSVGRTASPGSMTCHAEVALLQDRSVLVTEKTVLETTVRDLLATIQEMNTTYKTESSMLRATVGEKLITIAKMNATHRAVSLRLTLQRDELLVEKKRLLEEKSTSEGERIMLSARISELETILERDRTTIQELNATIQEMNATYVARRFALTSTVEQLSLQVRQCLAEKQRVEVNRTKLENLVETLSVDLEDALDPRKITADDQSTSNGASIGTTNIETNNIDSGANTTSFPTITNDKEATELEQQNVKLEHTVFKLQYVVMGLAGFIFFVAAVLTMVCFCRLTRKTSKKFVPTKLTAAVAIVPQEEGRMKHVGKFGQFMDRHHIAIQKIGHHDHAVSVQKMSRVYSRRKVEKIQKNQSHAKGRLLARLKQRAADQHEKVKLSQEDKGVLLLQKRESKVMIQEASLEKRTEKEKTKGKVGKKKKKKKKRASKAAKAEEEKKNSKRASKTERTVEDVEEDTVVTEGVAENSGESNPQVVALLRTAMATMMKKSNNFDRMLAKSDPHGEGVLTLQKFEALARKIGTRMDVTPGSEVFKEAWWSAKTKSKCPAGEIEHEILREWLGIGIEI